MREPLLPPERFLAQEALHLGAFADWEDVLALDAPPEGADFPTAVFHFVRRCVESGFLPSLLSVS